MTLDLGLTDKERRFLVTLLEAAHRGKLHEVHHTDTAGYKTFVKDEITLIEALRANLSAA